MPRVKHHRSSRRVPPPKDSDFDHEINLVDHSPSPPRTSTHDGESVRALSRDGPAIAGPSTGEAPETGSSPRSRGDAARTNGTGGHTPETNGPSVQVEEPTPGPEPTYGNGSAQEARLKAKLKPKSPESAIDILYENQRGGFLCGIPLFSSKALGNLDPPPWTNFAHKASPTDIHTAQVPDPSWEWAWPEWKINHEDDVDDGGWEYSFMFSKKFSWHKARWWNSFVRRRAWIRKRVKKDSGYIAQDPSMLGLEYFTVRPSSELERSPSRGASRRGSRLSGSRLSISTANEDLPTPNIESVEHLMVVLRQSRIDREKIEAIDNYLENADDDLAGLQDVMHEIMSLFVFQASRRALLSRLTEVYDKAVTDRDKRKDGEGADGLARRAENLAAAVKHADEEVRKLEYWSDVRGMVVEGESKGGVDEQQGWDASWEGLDKSGPKAPAPKHAN
ncbi:hypothetical protein QBC47DRAFT_332708 [Echria macrotheca]|uniref:Meiotically up-regulated 65 protein n=1 Tax=Echria macrotheca TaxID=438768 RepID=A0AAJ0B1J4_9PEZI|nr:hypothetical protein QBC47DRAFT_332708 [Echria macrotheca]